MIGGDEARALGDGNQRAEVVEEVDEAEDEDDLEQTNMDRRADVELEHGLRDVVQII